MYLFPIEFKDNFTASTVWNTGETGDMYLVVIWFQVYEVWRQASNDVSSFFTAPRLEILTWHDLHFFSRQLTDENRMKKLKFGREFVDLKKQFDTKENNFFFR